MEIFLFHHINYILLTNGIFSTSSSFVHYSSTLLFYPITIEGKFAILVVSVTALSILFKGVYCIILQSTSCLIRKTRCRLAGMISLTLTRIAAKL